MKNQGAKLLRKIIGIQEEKNKYGKKERKNKMNNLPCPFCGCSIESRNPLHKEGCWLGNLIQGEWGSRYASIDIDELNAWNKRYNQKEEK